MPLVCSHGVQLFFVHVPKTGGTSVEDYLSRRFGHLMLTDRNKHRNIPRTGLISPITHLSAVDLEEFVAENIDLCFAVVRDPVKRIVSEFRYQLSAPSRTSQLGFSNWLRIMVRCAKSEPRVYENHIRTQSQMIPESSEIYKLEDGFDKLIESIDQVTKSSQPDVQVLHKNSSEKKVQVTLTCEDIELITDYYAEDFSRFDYPVPSPADYPTDPYAPMRSLVGTVLAPSLIRKQRRDWLR